MRPSFAKIRSVTSDIRHRKKERKKKSKQRKEKKRKEKKRKPQR